MTCDKIRAKLSWYLDGELPEEESRELRLHVETCEACGTHLEEMRSTDAGIHAALQSMKPREGFTRRVVVEAGRRSRGRLRALVAAASILLAFGLFSAWVNARKASPLQIDVLGGEILQSNTMAALRVFVLNGASGAPLAGAGVRVSLAGRSLGDFRTTAAGTLDGGFAVPDLEPGSYPLRLEVESPLGRETLDRPVTVRRDFRLLLTTDKPMYQPGQTIRMRALAMNAFTLRPQSGAAEIEVLDSRGNKVFARKLTLSEYGIGSADFELADELNLGTYRIAVSTAGLRQERTVEVAKYALPKFRIDLEMTRELYRPGDPVRGVVRAKYFFGQPVRGRVQARMGRELVSGELREDGSWEFQAPASGNGQMPIEIIVTDTADHVERKQVPITVSTETLHVVLYPEGGLILGGGTNTLYAIVTTPDGRPVKADLRLIVNGTPQEVTTDDLGVARIVVEDWVDVKLAWARDRAGNETRSMRHLGEGVVYDYLLQLDKPAYRAGETMTVRIVGRPREPVCIDVIKNGQLLLAKTVGRGDTAIDLPPDLFGTVQVLAYTRNAERPQSRIAVVNAPEGLQIRPRAAKESFRPGEEMAVEFEVTDKDGQPVQAALGLSVVDEALFGLVESKIASEKAWLALAPELIETRGFLKAEANEIYRSQSLNAQRFVSGNAKTVRPPELLSNRYPDREAAVAMFAARYNEMLLNCAFVIGVLIAAFLVGFVLFRIGRVVSQAKVSALWVVIPILAVLGWAILAPGLLSSQRASSARYGSDAKGGVSPAEEPQFEYARAGHLTPKAEPRMPEKAPPPASAPARVRELFPETLYWNPQLITDERGRAQLTLPGADSITSWRLLSNAISKGGALGFSQSNLRVFQDFFVDIDFPLALTKGDRVHVPVAVYNYLKTPQTVVVRVEKESWFELLDEASKTISLKADEVSVVYFGLKVKEPGRKSLTVFADGGVKDAIKRAVEVMEKGREVPVNVAERILGRRALKLEIPERSIDGSPVLFVRITPGTGDLVTGLESMIRMPTGCFEQTLSSAYPNVAIHQYLKESGQLSAAAEQQLRQAHSIAVQKILSFEALSGGFGWYPQREPSSLLTAYGIMFLADLAKVYEFDRSVLQRSLDWIEKLQDGQGRWVAHDHGSTWARLSDAAIPTTAWVAWALKRAGREESPAVARAEEFLKRTDSDDAYAWGLIANAFPTKPNLDTLARLGKGGRWGTQLESWTRARGVSADLEATALAVMALASSHPAQADEGAGWIQSIRDASGGWGSTQATVLALRALAATGGGSRDKVSAKLSVNGKEIAGAFVESDAAQSYDISPYVVKGSNEIVLETSRKVNVLVAGRTYVPWGTEDLLRGVEGLTLKVAYDRSECKVGETLTCSVTVQADAFAMMAEVAIPPGFTVDASGLEELVRKRVIDKFTQSGRTLTFYLPGKGASFSYPLKARYPAKVAVPRSLAYEYYSPDRRVLVPPMDIEVFK